MKNKMRLRATPCDVRWRRIYLGLNQNFIVFVKGEPLTKMLFIGNWSNFFKMRRQDTTFPKFCFGEIKKKSLIK